MSEVTERFSSRVDDYVKYRPAYPGVLFETLERECGLDAPSVVADIGSGTGIATAPLLARGHRVFGVEPNQAMREAAERWLAHAPNAALFTSVAGRAEATGLADQCVDLVLVAQAFHWFDRDACRREFARIVSPGGSVALVWNDRSRDATPFLAAYEGLLRSLSIDYEKVNNQDAVSDSALAEFFAPYAYAAFEFANHQDFDRDGLFGRARSSSYVPREGHPAHERFYEELARIFDAYAVSGIVRFEYTTRLYWGRLERSVWLPQTKIFKRSIERGRLRGASARRWIKYFQHKCSRFLASGRLGYETIWGMFRRIFSANPGLSASLLGLAISASLAACASAPEGELDAPGAVQGELRVISVSSPDVGAKSTIYMLRVPGSDKDIPLDFDADPNLPSQTTLRVWGDREGSALHVTRHAVIEPQTDPELDRQALIGQPQTGRTAAWVQMNVNGGGVTQTKEEAERLIFNRTATGNAFGTRAGDKSLAQYYDEQSYGMLHLTGAVEGPIAYSGNVCPNNFDPPANAMRDAISAMGRTYDHYFLFWGTDQGCGAGWGAQGTRSRPGRYVWLNHATFCTATAQEIGHNFGMMHASTTDCGTTTLSNNMSGCTSSEYGNPMTVMGGGCKHLNAIEKWYEGWLLQCNGVRVMSTQTFTLFPIEAPCNGIQVLQIPFPSGAPQRQQSTEQSNGNVTLQNYYLEYRNGTGMDTGLATGVYVHLAPNVPAAGSNGPRTFLLDMQPSGNGFQAMTVGQTFDDPAGGVSFTVNSQDATSASVTVTVSTTGNNTCIDGTTLQGGGPTSCGGGTGGMGGAGGGGAGGMGGRGGTAGMGGRGGTGGMGGRGGTGGMGGMTGGTAGSGGMVTAGAGGSVFGGAGGAGGSGAEAGSAGTGTTGGSAGTATGGVATGGTAGTATSGSAGVPATGGATATGGGAGVGTSGTAGTDGGSEPEAVGDDGGCGCRVAGASSDHTRTAGSLALLGIALGAVIARRRRRH